MLDDDPFHSNEVDRFKHGKRKTGSGNILNFVQKFSAYELGHNTSVTYKKVQDVKVLADHETDHNELTVHSETSFEADDASNISIPSIDDDIELSELCDRSMNDGLSSDNKKTGVAVDEISENAERGLTLMVPEEDELSELRDESLESCLVEPVYDISHFVDKKLNDEKKMGLLKDVWKPDMDFKFPKGKRNATFKYHWFAEFSWLVYSKILDGAFCLFCVLFVCFRNK